MISRKFVNIAVSAFIVMWSCNVRNEQSQMISKEYYESIIFPLQHDHVHGPTIVELPNGDLLSAWFQGSGERWADDVKIMGARLVKGDTIWSDPFLMADTPGFPDINPMMFLDPEGRLWLMWYPVLANQWETSIPKFRISEDYEASGVPRWSWQDIASLRRNSSRGIPWRMYDKQRATSERPVHNRAPS